MKEEESLYPDIESWLNDYLTDRYKKYDVKTTYESSRQTLDVVLRKHGIEKKEAFGLAIKVDIIGILKKDDDVKLVFVEVKDVPLTLVDLGQLWGYTQLLEPIESFLVSSKGLGALQNLFEIHKRTDLLFYGQKHEKFMKVAKWDKVRKSIDYSTLQPKI